MLLLYSIHPHKVHCKNGHFLVLGKATHGHVVTILPEPGVLRHLAKWGRAEAASMITGGNAIGVRSANRPLVRDVEPRENSHMVLLSVLLSMGKNGALGSV